MKDQEKLDSRFDYAHALWLGSFHVQMRRDRKGVESRALIRTSAGIAVKRDVVAYILAAPHSRPPTFRERMQKLEPAVVALAIAAMAAVVVLMALRSIGG